MGVNKKMKYSVAKRKVYTYSGSLLGLFLGSLLVYYFNGNFPYEAVLGGLTGIIILLIIKIIKNKRKTHNIPEADERVTYNLFRFSSYMSHIVLAAFFITLAIYTFIGREVIPIFTLWIFFFSYIGIVAIGVTIIKRK